MVQNMNPEQIKSCFDIEGPSDEPRTLPEVAVPEVPGVPIAPTEDPLEALRKFCANKKYVIHKIIKVDGKDIVYFWYFSGGKWNY